MENCNEEGNKESTFVYKSTLQRIVDAEVGVVEGALRIAKSSERIAKAFNIFA